jgi:hypothetical protein
MLEGAREIYTAYFPLIRHGPILKWPNQKLFNTVGTSSSSCYFSTIRGIHRHKYSTVLLRFQHSLTRKRVYGAVT